MTTNRLPDFDPRKCALGNYLKLCRGRLDPVHFGISASRRRTPGLRREELAQRAGISVTWYTWLEQGRGGGPSREVLSRVAKALLLTKIEREHLFLLAFGSADGCITNSLVEDVPARLQRVLDAYVGNPAYIKTQRWDLLAWNEAANAVFGYEGLAVHDRNLLRRMFLNEETRSLVDDWDGVASFVVSTFRREVAHASDDSALQDLVAELCESSAEFRKLWLQHEVRTHGSGIKHLRLPEGRKLDLEYSAFVVDDSPELTMVVFNPVAATDAQNINWLLSRRSTLTATAGSSLRSPK
jgi:transcriptional regulator with XRE-family HTH domain